MLSIWRPAHPLWLAPHRPFFLLAGLWAALIPIVWFIPDGLGPEPVAWHRHELLFGMGGAAVGGYLLTALPAWTGGVQVPPTVTRLLVACWLAARLGFASGLSSVPAVIVEGSYFLALGWFLSQRVFKAKAWNRAPLAVAPFLLCGFCLLSMPGLGLADEHRVMRVLPLVYGLLVSLIGGRMLTAFTMHWLGRIRPGVRLADAPWTGRVALLALIMAIALLLFADSDAMAGSLLILSGALQVVRMLSWRSWRTFGYPALLLLHLAWLWLPLGLISTGISLLPCSPVDTATGLHALTMGAMGTMMLAIMGRAAMIRRDARLSVSWRLAVAFALVFLAAPLRLSVPFAEEHGRIFVLQLSVAFWSGGWLLFVSAFRPALDGRVPRPVLSARTSDPPCA